MEEAIIDLVSDEYFMQEALRQATHAFAADEVPVGAVMVREQRIIARAYNQVEKLKDATAHAEILVITQASEVVGDWRLAGCTLYVTKEPCLMCSGALVLARLDRLVFGSHDPKAGGAGGLLNIVDHSELNHRVTTKGGVLEDKCILLMKEFFLGKRRNAKEEKGS